MGQRIMKEYTPTYALELSLQSRQGGGTAKTIETIDLRFRHVARYSPERPARQRTTPLYNCPRTLQIRGNARRNAPPFPLIFRITVCA